MTSNFIRLLGSTHQMKSNSSFPLSPGHTINSACLTLVRSLFANERMSSTVSTSVVNWCCSDDPHVTTTKVERVCILSLRAGERNWIWIERMAADVEEVVLSSSDEEDTSGQCQHLKSLVRCTKHEKVYFEWLLYLIRQCWVRETKSRFLPEKNGR